MCKKTCLKKFVVMGRLLPSIYCAAVLGDIIYVDDDASPGGDGQTERKMSKIQGVHK